MSSFSYDPAERSLGDLMASALDDIEAEHGADPAADAAAFLHKQLLIHGERHTLEADDEARTVILRMHPTTALWLACLIGSTRRQA